MYVSNSEIDVFNDIIIHSEIIDSKITSSGKCIVSRGKMINTKAASRQGIEAHQIGTDKSPPCILKVGTNDHFQKLLKRYESII